MIRTYLIPLLAIAGMIFAVVTVIRTSRPRVAAPPVIEPPSAPFEAFVAGSGLVEAASQNIAVGTPVPGVVTAVDVRVGQDVRAGDPLFRIDDRELRAEVEVRRAALEVAERQLERLRLQPRAEELPVYEARVREAETALADERAQLEIWEKVDDRRAVSETELVRKRFAVKSAEARLLAARAQLALMRAGAWGPDVEVAEAQVRSARAALEAAVTEVERRVVRSPIDGRVLQVNVRVGEYAPAGPLQTPLLLLGSVDPLHVRVDVDEHEAWRVRPGADAVVFVRGNRDMNAPATFVRFEPYVVPKRSLTGESTERVDTRVLQLIYRFDPAVLPVFVGQQVDVYIQADPLEQATPPPHTPSVPSRS
jgi:multidrug resistance efflux pump